MELLSSEPRWLAGQESLLPAPTSYHTAALKASQGKPGLEGSHPKTTRHTSIQRPFHSTVIILISRPALKSILLSSHLIPNAGLVELYSHSTREIRSGLPVPPQLWGRRAGSSFQVNHPTLFPWTTGPLSPLRPPSTSGRVSGTL